MMRFANYRNRGFIISVLLILLSFLCACQSQSNRSLIKVEQVSVITDSHGHKLQVDGRDFMVNGMNWDYYPQGTNYSYSFWAQPDSFIHTALDYEMSLLQELGVNAIRQYVGIPPRWVEYLHANYGIYTILNHTFARYGFRNKGEWISRVDYASPELREIVLNDISEMIEIYEHTPGILMWMLGNENNYGLFWESAETQDIPENDNLRRNQAASLYSLMNESVELIHKKDSRRPVALANGDTQFIEMIASEVKNLDIFGANVYRGESFGDIFQVVEDALGIPILFTEFGADAFNAVRGAEDQGLQAKYLLSNWEEIYSQSFGKGSVGNAIGGCTFQFSDGWWKSDLDANLSTHDTHASWSNGGYAEDFVPGKNNMNEEWFGICAKGPTDSLGHYKLYPRLAYSALKQVHTLNPYAVGVDRSAVLEHFSKIRQSKIGNFASRETSKQIPQNSIAKL